MTSSINPIAPTALVDATEPEGDRARGAVPKRERRSWAWLGLLPFLAFLFIFLLLPAYGVVQKALTGDGGGVTLKGMTDAIRKEKQAFWNSVNISLLSAALGAVLGALLAYAAATAKRPKWLRTMVTAFSGVGANMGGVILAFMFFSAIGRTGLVTRWLDWGGYDLYGGRFELSRPPGLITVYLYFQIPLMVLVTLPAIDGLQQSWREASSNLGGTTWTYWRRIGIPVLTPSLLGGFLLLFANSFSAFATAYSLGSGSVNIVPVKISFSLQGDIATGGSEPFALATWMIIFMVVSMAGYLVLRRRSERWRR